MHACTIYMVGCISPQDTVRKACFYKWDPEEENTPVDNLNIMEITLSTLRPRQMDAISQTTFSNAFS